MFAFTTILVETSVFGTAELLVHRFVQTTYSYDTFFGRNRLSRFVLYCYSSDEGHFLLHSSLSSWIRVSGVPKRFDSYSV